MRWWIYLTEMYHFLTILTFLALSHSMTGRPVRPTERSRHQPEPTQSEIVPTRFSQDNEIQNLFNKLEEIFSVGDANQLGSLLASKVYISLFTGESGMFSSNQTYFILKKLFEEYRMIALTFQTQSVNASSPYAMGQLQYLSRGRKMSAQLYVSFVRTDQGWKMNHLTISHQN